MSKEKIKPDDLYALVHSSWNLKESIDWEYYANALNASHLRYYPIDPKQGLRVLVHPKENIEVLIACTRKEPSPSNVGHPLLDKYRTEKDNFLQALATSKGVSIPSTYSVNAITTRKANIHFAYRFPFTAATKKVRNRLFNNFESLFEDIIEELNEKRTFFALFGKENETTMLDIIQDNNPVFYCPHDFYTPKVKVSGAKLFRELNIAYYTVTGKVLKWGERK
jgi:hypothetical protein